MPLEASPHQKQRRAEVLLNVPSRRRWLKRQFLQQVAKVAPGYFARQLRRPCFLIGSPRSGSSLFDQLLGSHPEVVTYPSEALELWHPQAFPWRHAVRRKPFPPLWGDAQAFTQFSLAHRSPSQDRHLVASFGACQWLSGRTAFVQKCTMIGTLLPHVMRLFPEARFIHILRDGRAAAWSWAKREQRAMQRDSEPYRRSGWQRSQDELLRACAHAWREIVQAIDDCREAFQWNESQFLELQYEALCSDPTSTLQRATDFLGVPANQLDARLVAAVASQNFKFSSELDAATLNDLNAICGDVLLRKGYSKRIS